MKRSLQTAVFVACVVFSVAGAYNVMSDSAEVEKLAEEVACSTDTPAVKPPRAGTKTTECHARMTSHGRTPIAQTFEFNTTKGPTVVRCGRSLVLVGEYACTVR